MLQSRDPARFRVARLARAPLRDALLLLYAFNAEVVHAAWGTQEPALAEIRLQYWFDQVEALFGGKPTDNHPVLNALARAEWLQWQARSDFLGLIDARRWDVWRDPFADTDALLAYLHATGGNLMAMGARVVRMSDHYDGVIRRYGRAAALAAFFAAVPALKACGRQPLPDESPEALAALAGTALADLRAPRGQAQMKPARIIMLSASEAQPMLQRVVRQPELVLTGGLQRSEFRKRLRAIRCGLFGPW